MEVTIIESDDEIPKNRYEVNVDTDEEEDSDIMETEGDTEDDENFPGGAVSDPDSESDLDRISAAAKRARNKKMKCYEAGRVDEGKEIIDLTNDTHSGALFRHNSKIKNSPCPDFVRKDTKMQ